MTDGPEGRSPREGVGYIPGRGFLPCSLLLGLPDCCESADTQRQGVEGGVGGGGGGRGVGAALVWNEDTLMH